MGAPDQGRRRSRAIQAPSRPRATVVVSRRKKARGGSDRPCGAGSIRRQGAGARFAIIFIGWRFYEHPRDRRRRVHRLAHGQESPRRRPTRRRGRRPLDGERREGPGGGRLPSGRQPLGPSGAAAPRRETPTLPPPPPPTPPPPPPPPTPPPTPH